MRKLALLAPLLLVAGLAVAAAGKARTFTANTSNLYGVPPSATTDGVDLDNMEFIQCSVHGIASTVTGGSVLWYVLPRVYEDGDGGWMPLGEAKQTITQATTPDGGAQRRYQFKAQRVGGRYGRAVCIGNVLSGTADDAGTASFAVRTEAWGTEDLPSP